MERTYWLKQTLSKPLFPELEWSRPQQRATAGKLLIIGGHLHGFAAPAEAYAAAGRAGIGTARVLLPSAVQKVVGRVLENGEFAASTPSGSFSQKALDEWLAHAQWADGVLLAGDLGRNSEVAIVLEKFLAKYPGQVTVTKDAVDYITSTPRIAIQRPVPSGAGQRPVPSGAGQRPETLLVLSLSQLQRLSTAAKFGQAVTFDMDLLRLVDWLHDFSSSFKPYLVVKHLDHVFVAVNGQVSSTRLEVDQPIWRVATAAQASVWWVQHPSKPFEAITVSLVDALGS